VRFALSPTAAKELSEARLRRLLEIELGDEAVLAPATAGPLGDHVTYVWVDLHEPSTVVIEVRAGVRPVDRREIADAELTGDIVVRVIAIAAAEMVRTQMRPLRPPRKPPPPKPPSPEEIEAASREADAVTWNPRAVAAFVPSAGAAMFGPGFDLGFRRFGVGAHLTADWLTGPTSTGSARWFEVGLGASYRFWLGPSLRVAGELSAAGAAVRLAGASIGGESPLTLDTWSARAGASIGLEWRAAEPVWLTAGVGPSVLLRSFDLRAAGSVQGTFEGAFVGLSLGVLFEQRAPVHLKALQKNGAP
jgi:hypothetical protein